MATGKSKSARVARPARKTTLLIATRKGLWTLTGDATRRNFKIEGPNCLGNIVHHAMLDPRDGRSFAPPPTDVRPSLTAAQALAAFMIVDRAIRLQPAAAWLGTYSWPYRQLAWGFRYSAMCEPAFSPVSHTVDPVVPVPCTRWLFLNAKTGRMLEDIAQQARD